MPKILLIGSQGQLGQELSLILPSIGTLTSVSRAELDLTSPRAVEQVILDSQPSLIINAAAYTAVDKAQSEPDIAQAVNAIAPQIMAKTAAGIGAKFLHVSTDYVFNGSKNTPYLESDPTQPLGVYGSSKLAGEIAVLEDNPQALILRTAWVYGVFGKGNFVKTMLRLGRERPQLKVVMDQVGSPSWAQDIAEAIAKLIVLPEVSGIYHFTNSGVTSWYDFAHAIFSEARSLGFPLQIQELLPIITAEYPTPAQRPAYSVLSNRKIAAVFGYHPPHWRDSLQLMLKQLASTSL
jgi:dTDP-4-dehydrorhamnose reductase